MMDNQKGRHNLGFIKDPNTHIVHKTKLLDQRILQRKV